MTMVEKIRKIIKNSDFEEFGLRADDYEYNIGDDAHVSHQLFVDPQIDEYGNLLYPEGEGFYKNFYDAGELGGTCAIEINDYDSDEKIARKINALSAYNGNHYYIIAGNGATYGNDVDEVIIRDAKIIAILD